MSNLQISLILIGALFVIGMVLYNGWQQRSHRRRTESLFESRHDDVLLDDFKPVSLHEEESRVDHHFVDLDEDIPQEEEIPVLAEPA